MAKTSTNIFKYIILKPASIIYGFGVWFRNRLFDQKILKSRVFDVPTISVGNISVGGTGKTPHTEYLVKKLSDKYNIAVLSRGYKRKTKGYVLANMKSSPFTIGDEPFQIYRKFRDEKISVAVCEKRCIGIDNILRDAPKTNLIILDDAFQHRYVKPSVSIVLMDYNKPIYYDNMLPFGRLREPMSSLMRADIVVVTKCPNDITPMQIRVVKKNLDLFPFQKLYFSTYSYGNVTPLFPQAYNSVPNIDTFNSNDAILVVTGIANPSSYMRHLKRKGVKVKGIKFPDHHNFNEIDFERIGEVFSKMKGERKYIFTTEKDAVRIANLSFVPENLRESIFYIPIEVCMMSENKDNIETSVIEAIKSRM